MPFRAVLRQVRQGVYADERWCRGLQAECRMRVLRLAYRDLEIKLKPYRRWEHDYSWHPEGIGERLTELMEDMEDEQEALEAQISIQAHHVLEAVMMALLSSDPAAVLPSPVMSLVCIYAGRAP